MRLLLKSIGLLVVVSALGFASVGAAAAATATISPGGGVSGNGTSPWELTINQSVRFNCVNAGFSANLAATATGPLPLLIGTRYQQNFSNCSTGGRSYTFACTPTATLSATGLTSTSGVTLLSLNALNCTASIGGCGSASITGSLPESFANGPSQLTVLIPGQAITVSGSTCSAIPNGPAVFSAPGGGPFTYTVSPTTTITVV